MNRLAASDTPVSGDLPFEIARCDFVSLGDVPSSHPLAGQNIAVAEGEQNQQRAEVWADIGTIRPI
jgi:hypothetical protein